MVAKIPLITNVPNGCYRFDQSGNYYNVPLWDPKATLSIDGQMCPANIPFGMHGSIATTAMTLPADVPDDLTVANLAEMAGSKRAELALNQALLGNGFAHDCTGLNSSIFDIG